GRRQPEDPGHRRSRLPLHRDGLCRFGGRRLGGGRDRAMSLAIESADERGCRVVWNGRPLLDYHCGDVKSFIHPLRTLEGDVLTVDRPWDHVWHRGLYFAWKLIDGVNYWGEGLEGPGPWGRMRPVS